MDQSRATQGLIGIIGSVVTAFAKNKVQNSRRRFDRISVNQ
jgi:hypothetical protein